METVDVIKNYLDDNQRIKVWPSKKKYKMLALEYLASKLSPGTFYSEKEVNEILKRYNSFNDHVLLRRELYDHGFLDRERDGSRYWRTENKSQIQPK